jgi:hypothetical protein
MGQWNELRENRPLSCIVIFYGDSGLPVGGGYANGRMEGFPCDNLDPLPKDCIRCHVIPDERKSMWCRVQSNTIRASPPTFYRYIFKDKGMTGEWAIASYQALPVPIEKTVACLILVLEPG